jgi:putative glutamine amidotransferase
MLKVLIAPRYTNQMGIERAQLSTSFSNYLIANGAIPLMLVPESPLLDEARARTIADRYVEEVDGVVLQGGNDIHPSLYGAEVAGATHTHLSRDLFEISLLHAAVAAGKPIFGVCRGMQLINVARGGTLFQHLDTARWLQHFATDAAEFSEQCAAEIRHLEHPVSLEPSGLLSRLFRADTVTVNSYHHQGINRLGTDLRIEARSRDGLVEAISCERDRILGVQWHPELRFFDDHHYGMIFRFWLHEWVAGQGGMQRRVA